MIQQIDKAHHECRQHRKGKHKVCELVGIVVVRGDLIFRHRLFDLAVDGENIVPILEKELNGRLVRRAVGAVLENDKAHAEMVALIDPAVHDETVDLRVFLICLEVGGKDQRHVGDAHPLAPLFVDIAAQDLHVRIFGDVILRVIALGHDIGDRRDDRRGIFHSYSIRTHRTVPPRSLELPLSYTQTGRFATFS